MKSNRAIRLPRWQAWTACAVLAMASGAAAAADAASQPAAHQVTADSIKMFPAAQAGQKRFVIALPADPSEADLRVELMIGKTLRVDCNQHWFGGSLREETVQGWGYTYYRLDEAKGPAATMRACPAGRPRRLRAGARRHPAAALQQPPAAGGLCAGRLRGALPPVARLERGGLGRGAVAGSSSSSSGSSSSSSSGSSSSSTAADAPRTTAVHPKTNGRGIAPAAVLYGAAGPWPALRLTCCRRRHRGRSCGPVAGRHHLAHQHGGTVLRIGELGVQHFHHGQHGVRPIMSASAKGPIGWLQPSFMPSSISSGEAGLRPARRRPR